jgi:hypothetical protein
METHLGSRHRDTVERIFGHPPSHNIEWREVASLLEAIGSRRGTRRPCPIRARGIAATGSGANRRNLTLPPPELKART